MRAPAAPASFRARARLMPEPGLVVVPRANNVASERRCALDGDANGNRGSKVPQTYRDGSLAVPAGIVE